MSEIIEKIKNYFSQDEEELPLLRNLAILGLIGILLILYSNNFMQTDPVEPMMSEPKEKEIEVEKPYLTQLELDLENILSQIEGVGTVKVDLRANGKPENNYVYNERENNKDINKELAVLRESNGGEEPVIAQTIYPRLTSALVVAEGAENVTIKYDLAKALSSYLDLPLYKVTVMPHRGR